MILLSSDIQKQVAGKLHDGKNFYFNLMNPQI